MKVSKEVFKKFIDILSILSTKEVYREIIIKNGRIRCTSSDQSIVIDMDVSNIIPFDFNLFSIKDKVEKFKLFIGNKDEKDIPIDFMNDTTHFSISDGTTTTKILHSNLSYFSSVYIEDSVLQNLLGVNEVLFSTTIPKSILIKTKKFSEAYSNDLLQIAITDKINLICENTNKTETTQLISFDVPDECKCLENADISIKSNILSAIDFDGDITFEIISAIPLDENQDRLTMKVIGEIKGNPISAYGFMNIQIDKETFKQNKQQKVIAKEEESPADETKVEETVSEPIPEPVVENLDISEEFEF